MSEQRVRRDVISEDPTLSPRANDLLTGELREALGTDRVEVPADTPAEELLAHARHADDGARGAAASMAPALVVIGGILLVTGAIVSLVTGSLWALVAAVGVHAVLTVIVISWGLSRTTLVEHMDPGTAARLEREGVADPDAVLNTLVDELSGGQSRERRTVTPTAGRSAPVDDADAVPQVLEWVIFAVVAGSSIVIALVVGGTGWLVPLIVLPLSVAWLVGQRVLSDGGPISAETPRERARLRRAAPRIVLLLAVCTAIAVAGGVLILALVLDGV